MGKKITYTNEVVDSYSGQLNCEAGIYLNGDIIGVVEYVLYDKELTVSDIFVKPEFRRQGYGSKLMKYIKQENPDSKYEPSMMLPDGAKFIHKDVQLESFEAQYVYENLDFERGKDPKISIGLGMEERIHNESEDWYPGGWDEDYNSALTWSAEVGKIDILKWLLDAGADPTHEDSQAMKQAATFGQKEAVEILINAGANPYAGNGYAMMAARFAGYTEVADFIQLEAGKPPEGASFMDSPKTYESLDFERGKEPKEAMEIGKVAQINAKVNDIDYVDDLIDELELDWEAAMGIYLTEDKKKELARIYLMDKHEFKILNQSDDDEEVYDELGEIIEPRINYELADLEAKGWELFNEENNFGQIEMILTRKK